MASGGLGPGMLARLPGLLLRRDPLVEPLPRLGRCDSCGQRTTFVRLVDPAFSRELASWPYPQDYLRWCATRENWFCVRCRRSYRMRTLASVVWPHAPGSDLYHAGTRLPLAGERAAAPRSVVLSAYVEGTAPGTEVDGVVHQDLQRLTFEDASFDLVVTSEVFEHVADPWAGFAEVRRVLRPGGRHVFTVPDTRAAETRSREGLPTVLHVDGPGGTIPVVTDYGNDLPDRLAAHGFATTVHGFPAERPVTHVFESVAV